MIIQMLKVFCLSIIHKIFKILYLFASLIILVLCHETLLSVRVFLASSGQSCTTNTTANLA